MTKMKELHKKWMRHPEYRREYDALEEETAVASAKIEARSLHEGVGPVYDAMQADPSRGVLAADVFAELRDRTKRS